MMSVKIQEKDLLTTTELVAMVSVALVTILVSLLLW